MIEVNQVVILSRYSLKRDQHTMGEGLGQIFRIHVRFQLNGTDPVNRASQSTELSQQLLDWQRAGIGAELQHQHVTHHQRDSDISQQCGSSYQKKSELEQRLQDQDQQSTFDS